MRSLVVAVVVISWLPSLARGGAVDVFIDSHCIDCHDESTAKGDFDITALSYPLAVADLGRWTRVFDRIEHGEMPPPEKSKVSSDERRQFLAAFGTELLAASKANLVQEGRGGLRRLTRVEFENNLRLLLELPHLISGTNYRRTVTLMDSPKYPLCWICRECRWKAILMRPRWRCERRWLQCQACRTGYTTFHGDPVVSQSRDLWGARGDVFRAR